MNRDRLWKRLVLAVSYTFLIAVAGVQLLGADDAAVEQEWDVLSSHPDRIVLNWSEDPATSQSVTWRTDASVRDPIAQYALASPGPRFEWDAETVQATTETLDARETPDAGPRASFHSATFRNLVPDTVYAYRVGDGVRWSEWFHFRTASTEPEPFSFIYFGDAQNDVLSLWSRTIRSSYAAAPDARFMIHAGDLVNRAHANNEWAEWFRAGGFIHAMVPGIPAPGNHEYRARTPDEEEAEERHLSLFWRPQFTLPQNGPQGLKETSYFIDYQGARIVVLNSNERLEEQALWLDQVLSYDPQKWTVVTFHHPVFSTGRERDNPRVRELWKPVLDKHRVDLVLQGHDHTYARGRSSSEENLYTGANGRDEESGTVYVVSVSGAKMYEFKPDQWAKYPATLDRRAENTQLFQVVRVAGDTLRYRAHTAVGDLYDSFELIKNGDGPNRFVELTEPGAHTRTFADPPAYERP